jgi:hypothetical protein
LANTFWSIGALASNDVLVGQRYEVVGGLYAYGVALDLDTKQLAVISLAPLNLRGSEILSKQSVPKGSILTIVGRGPKRFLQFLYPDEYIVRLSGFDAPAGVPVVIDLSGGIEGKSTPLNPRIFKPIL